MKVFIFLLGLSAVAAFAPTAGYKPFGKYVYNYTGSLEIVPGTEKQQSTGVRINADVEFHFLPNAEVLLSIPKAEVLEEVLDPKISFRPIMKESPHSELIRKFLSIPIKFVYRDGLVSRVFNRADDPLWSINMKKGLVNLLHVDVMGKDLETEEKSLFTKEEMSVYGICNTTYTMKDFSQMDVNRMVKVGMNITKVIDTTNCTMQPFERFSSLGVPTIAKNLDDYEQNPLRTSTIITYNLIGNENRFKFQQINATGRFIFVPFVEREGIVMAATKQRLTYVREGSSTIKRDHPEWLNLPIASTLITPIEKVKLETSTKREEIVKMITDLLFTVSKVFLTEVSYETPLKVTMPEIYLRLVNSLRLVDIEILESVWTHCANHPENKKWLLYGLSMTGNEIGLDFIQKKILNKDITVDMIGEFLPNLGFVTKPTLEWLNKVKTLCSIELVKKDGQLNQTCIIVISNALKSYCEVLKHCNSEVDKMQPTILSYLERITTPCDPTNSRCWTEAEIMPVLIAAENLGFVSYWPQLKKIILDNRYSMVIRTRAIGACRLIMLRNPTHIRVFMWKLFREPLIAVELRALAFEILMANPTPNLIKLTSATIYREQTRELKSFVLSRFDYMLKRDPNVIGKDIYAACVIAKKLYHLSVYPRLITTSFHGHHEIINAFYNRLRAYGYRTMLFTNETIFPRHAHVGFNMTLFGRSFNIFHAEMRMEGLQQYLSQFAMNVDRPEKKSTFNRFKADENSEFVNEEFNRINKQVPVKPRAQESFKLSWSINMFNKIMYFNYTAFENKQINWKELLFKGLIFKAASFERELKDGKSLSFAKAFIPIEVVYTIPTNIGWPLTLNATVVAMTKIDTKYNAEVHPSLFSPRSVLSKEREWMKATVVNNLTAVTQLLAGMYFRIPLMEVGVRFNKTMNITKCTHVNAKYDFKTKEYEVDYRIPTTDVALLSDKVELYQYIRPELLSNVEPTKDYHIRRYNITVDQFSTFKIMNGTHSMNATTRHAVWALKMENSQYLCVVQSVITTCTKPFYFNVIFHGPHHRIVSLYAPEQGYVTMSHKSNCLQLKEKLTKQYAKLFVIDYIHPQEIRLKTLIRMPKQHWPTDWDMPTVRDYEHLKEIEEIYMRELVTMEQEDLVEEMINPEILPVRVVYLKVAQGIKKVCVTPRMNEASRLNVIVKKSFEDVLRNVTLSTGFFLGRSWGFGVSAHGYKAMLKNTPLLKQIITPMEYSVWLRRDETTKPMTRIHLKIQNFDNKWESSKYKYIISFIGTVPKRQIIVTSHTIRSLLERKLDITIEPSNKELLQFEKMCFNFVSQPDYLKYVASMDSQCRVNHLALDVVKPDFLPRHWLTYRLNYTYESLPLTWRYIFNGFSRLFHHGMRTHSSYVYRTNNTNLTGRNSTHFTWHITTPYTLDLITKTDRMTYGIKDIRIPFPKRTFPKGSNITHLNKKLHSKWMAPSCTHKNTTFTTFDDVSYNYNLTGNCEHILLRNCSQNVTNFVVLVKRHPEDYRLRIVTILAGQHKIEIIPHSVSLVPTFKINGKEEVLQQDFFMLKKHPERTQPLLKIKWEQEFKNFYVHYFEGLDLIVELKEGWKIKTGVSPLLVSKTCGLCGNFDMEQAGEFETPQQRLTNQPHIFGVSWIVPVEKCTEGCTFKSEFLKFVNKDMRTRRMSCLTKFRLPKCLASCKPIERKIVRIPTVCVPETYQEKLKNQLIHGENIVLKTAEHYETNVEYDVKCDCPCKKDWQFKRIVEKKSMIRGVEDFITGLFFDEHY